MKQKSALDIWAAWILDRRFGDNAELMRQVYEEFLYPIRDRVLDNAAYAEGETLLDVGCGDGLIPFGALSRTQTGPVIFSDISQDLLDYCAEIVEQTEDRNRSQFLNASADDLSALHDNSVDVVTSRSVLVYISDKEFLQSQRRWIRF